MTNPPGGPPYRDPRGQSGWAPSPPPGRGGQPPTYGSDDPTQFNSLPPTGSPPAASGTQTPESPPKRRRRLRDPISIVLILVIVLAVVASLLVGGELFIRHIADKKGREATECVTRDKAEVKIGATPPLLWQIVTDHYTNITITTAGNQIKNAKGMKADIVVKDVRLDETADSQGTIGSIDATITWSADGIKQTIQDQVPIIGSFITGVSTNKEKGTLELEAALGSITATPAVVNGKLTLQMVSITGLGFTIPKETVAPALESLSNLLAEELPLGIHAESAEVTDSGVVARFVTRDATIPKESQDPCFASL